MKKKVTDILPNVANMPGCLPGENIFECRRRIKREREEAKKKMSMGGKKVQGIISKRV